MMVDIRLCEKSPKVLIHYFVKLTVDGTIIKGRMRIMNVPEDPDRVYVGLRGFRLFRADSMDSKSEFISKYPVSFEFDEVTFRQKPVDKAFVGDHVQINGDVFVIEGIKYDPNLNNGYKVFRLADYSALSSKNSKFKEVPSDIFDYVLEQRRFRD